jgi:hypothetical protein
MPLILGDRASVPDSVWGYVEVLDLCAKVKPEYAGQVVYLTIDEKVVEAGQTHRRPRLHVDGWHKTEDGSTSSGTWGGGGGSWGGAAPSGGTGLLTIASRRGCRAYKQDFEGFPAPEGDCEHLRPQCREGEVLEMGTLYWLGALCVHESLPMAELTPRQFVRLSMPSTADWYEGCTPNPRGVLPTGRVRPRRRFMKSRYV